jgi:hypothetical protein
VNASPRPGPDAGARAPSPAFAARGIGNRLPQKQDSLRSDAPGSRRPAPALLCMLLPSFPLGGQAGTGKADVRRTFGQRGDIVEEKLCRFYSKCHHFLYS